MAGAGFGGIDEEDEDMQDAVLLSSFDWSPASLDDIHGIPARTLDLYAAYHSGVIDRHKANRE